MRGQKLKNFLSTISLEENNPLATNISQEGIFDKIFSNNLVLEVRSTGFDIYNTGLLFKSERSEHDYNRNFKHIFILRELLWDCYYACFEFAGKKYIEHDNWKFVVKKRDYEDPFNVAKFKNDYTKICTEIFNKKYNIENQLKLIKGKDVFTHKMDLNVSKYSDIFGPVDKDDFNRILPRDVLGLLNAELSDLDLDGQLGSNAPLEDLFYEHKSKFIGVYKKSLEYEDFEEGDDIEECAYNFMLFYICESDKGDLYDIVANILKPLCRKLYNSASKLLKEIQSNIDVKLYKKGESWDSPNAIPKNVLLRNLKSSSKIVFTNNKYSTESFNILNEYYKTRMQIDGLVITSKSMTVESGFPIIEKVSLFFISKLNSIKNALGFVSDSTSDKAISVKTDANAFVRGINEYRKYLNKFNHLQYGELTQLDVAVVVGVKVNLIDTTKLLLKTFDLIHKDAKTAVDNLDALVSKILSDESFRASTRPVKPDADLNKIVKKLEDDLESIMDPRKIADRGQLKDLIRNFDDIPEVFNNIMTLADGYTIKDLQELSNISDAIYEKVVVLLDKIKTDKKLTIGKPLMAKLAADIENGARLIAIIASYNHLFNQTVSIFKLLIDRLRDIKK